MLHVAHRNEAVDTLQAEPVDHVRHQLLAAGILHPGHAFGALEILRGGIAALLALASVVNQELGDFAERAAFLAIIDDDAEPAGLPGARAFLNAVKQVWAAGADVRTEYVGAVAFVMHAA